MAISKETLFKNQIHILTVSSKSFKIVMNYKIGFNNNSEKKLEDITSIFIRFYFHNQKNQTNLLIIG